MKKSIIAAIVIVAALTSASCKKDEKAARVAAEVEAAQMEGRNAAKEFVNTQWKDTLELQDRLLQVRARQSKYVMNKQPEAAVAFDSTFVSTLKTVRPDVAAHLDRH